MNDKKDIRENKPTTREMVKILLLGILFLFPFSFLPLQAQNGFNMPFSQFGLGLDNRPYNLPIAARTGGIAYTRAGNNYINPFNPASYAAIERESFVFDMGVGLQVTTLRDNTNTLRDADGNLAYLMMAMPVTKWWKLAAGLMPLSTVDYETVVSEDDPVAGSVKTVYDGTGGINEIFLGSAFNILRGGDKKTTLQAGFNLYYLTGSVDRSITYSFTNTSAYYLNKRRYKETSINNFCFDLGLQLRQPLGNRAAVTLGLVYKPYLDLKVKDMAIIYTCHANAPTMVVDTIFPARGANTEYRSDLEQAQTFGVGLGFEIDKRWLVAADATFASWQGLKYTERQNPPVFNDGTLVYGPYSRYAFGLERTGTMDATSYWGRMSWSLGAHMAQGMLRLNIDGTEHRLDQWGVGAGISMPMRKGRSLLTLSVDYSSLGTPDLLQSDMLTFGIAVSSCERWFFKRKFN